MRFDGLVLAAFILAGHAVFWELTGPWDKSIGTIAAIMDAVAVAVAVVSVFKKPIDVE